MPRACEKCGTSVGLYEPECAACGTPNTAYRTTRGDYADRQSTIDEGPSSPFEPPSTPWYRRPGVKTLGTVVAIGVFALFRAGVFEAPPEDQFLSILEEDMKIAGMSDSGWDCIEEKLREDGSVEELANLSDAELENFDPTAFIGFADAGPEVQTFLEAFAAHSQRCLSIEEQAGLEFQAPTGSPMTYGSDPTLDVLHDGCTAGSNAEYDMLYIASPIGSDYEAQSLVCGGRTAAIEEFSTTCMLTEQDFAETDDLKSQCQTGFFPACDVLFNVTMIGSDDEAFAVTCGERVETEVPGTCTLLYGFGTRN